MTQTLRTEAFMQAALATWGDAVYRLALAQARSASDAQDIAQDVFIRLMESALVFESDEHLKAWLLRVTINRCHDLHRSAWRSKVDSLDIGEDETGRRGGRLDTLADSHPSPEDAAIAALGRGPVWDAMSLLPEELRLIMHLRYVEECDSAQIARILGCKPTTVRTRLFRARKRLRELLRSMEDTDRTRQKADIARRPTARANMSRAPSQNGQSQSPPAIAADSAKPCAPSDHAGTR